METSTHTALITGGASGIGLETAHLLRSRGYRVITADLAGGDEKVDVSDPDSVARLREKVGEVDVLINSAGIVGPSSRVEDTEYEDWRRTFAVNVDGVFLMCRAFAPGMTRRGWGRIVNLSSIAAKEGNPLQSAYSASKAAVIGLTKSLGKELACTGVLVNAVAPAAVRTPMNESTDPAILARSQALTPLGRFAEPTEIAQLIAWLCAEEMSFSTGAVFDASGGRASY